MVQRAATVLVVDAFFARAVKTVRNLSAEFDVTGSLDHAFTRQDEFSQFLGDVRLAIDNNIAENALAAPGRKNHFFANADSCGDRAVARHMIVEMPKMNELKPETCLRHTLAKIADGHLISRIGEFMARWAR
jgi:transposase